MILLDTHVVLWMSSESRRLSKKAREAILHAREAAEIAVSTFTFWELAWLAENHRVIIPGSVETFVSDTVSRMIVRPMTPQIVALAVRLPTNFPKDPADRVIAATAIVNGIPLVTADQRIQQSGVVETIW